MSFNKSKGPKGDRFIIISSTANTLSSISPRNNFQQHSKVFVMVLNFEATKKHHSSRNSKSFLELSIDHKC